MLVVLGPALVPVVVSMDLLLLMGLVHGHQVRAAVLVLQMRDPSLRSLA